MLHKNEADAPQKSQKSVGDTGVNFLSQCYLKTWGFSKVGSGLSLRAVLDSIFDTYITIALLVRLT